MKFINYLFFIFISLVTMVKADLNKNLTAELKEGGKLIFIRHAYAPGSGDPNNFDINDCNTQRNLNQTGKEQSKKIGSYFKKNKIPIDKVISSEWCRCKETALIGFEDFETKNFLNSFFSSKFAKNRNQQIKDLKKYINEWQSEKNLVLITHFVVIFETLDYATASGEIVISDKNFKKIGSVKIDY
jgi:phosphohistidine phosphatase SixA|tara:strand:+ start:64 stop:621 length:558 start_codon:yes stop_codon:yes gene_type:complete